MYVFSSYSADEPMVRVQHKVSASLKQALEKLKLSENTTEKKGIREYFFLLLTWVLILSFHFTKILFYSVYSYLSPLIFFVSCHIIEEDEEELKIGTSCKNGGCTKVSELEHTVFCVWIFQNFLFVILYNLTLLRPTSIIFWAHLKASLVLFLLWWCCF